MINNNKSTIQVIPKPDLTKQLSRRPMLSDPEEYKIIKQIHFHKDIFDQTEQDQLERWDRMTHRKNRNQSR